ncbi:PREDICTED: probable endochitinase [Camelina sativa]|uniref:Probable endochitinase n=1 Tax=Camelina sativa TaxID=90675 RepID=A0ABM0Y6P8_CAMSA|nr:PREDICTED: probable endochitinase [Camelina sativa]
MADTNEEMGAPSVVKASYWYPDGEDKDPATSAQTIPSALFTHLFCAFADLDADTHKAFISEVHAQRFATFTETVKIRNDQVKTLLSIGGRLGNNSAFASMASKQQSRKKFIDSWISIARSNGFNGLDLAWEYPNNETEMTDFGALVGELRYAVDAEHRRTSKPTLLLTAAVYYSSVYKTFTYPVKVMKDNLDWVNIIAYELYTPLSYPHFTAPPAGLHAFSLDEDRSGDSGFRKWVEDGLPKNKAVFGFPYVGYAWTLQNDMDNGYHAAASGVAKHEDVSEDGSINYDKIQKFITDEKAAHKYDSAVVGNHCFANKIWIAYDDTESVTAKVTYAKQNVLLGYFAWNVGADVNTVLSTAAWKAWSG